MKAFLHFLLFRNFAASGSRRTSVKRLIPMFALGIGTQFEIPQSSFFQTSPSNEEILSESLAERENVHPVEAMKTLPGIVMLGSEVTTYTGSLFLRGASADHTLFIWNDLRADDFTSPGGASDPFGLGTEFSNKIRILKGPQSLLYGTQALGGVVLIDEDPDLDSSLAIAGGSLQSLKSTFESRTHHEIANSQRLQRITVAAGASGFTTSGLSTYDAPLRQGADGRELERDSRQQFSGTALLTLDLRNNRTDPLAFGKATDNNESGKLSAEPLQAEPLLTREAAADQLQLLFNTSEMKARDDVPPLDDTDAKTQRTVQQLKVRYRKVWNERWKSLFLLTGQQTLRDSENRPDVVSPNEYADRSEGTRTQVVVRNTLKTDQSLWHFGAEVSEDAGRFFSRSTFQPLPLSIEARRQEQSLYAVNDWIFARSDVSGGVRASCQDQDRCVGVYQLSYQWHWPEQQRSMYGIISSGHKRPTLYQLYSSYGAKDLYSEVSTAYELGFLQRWDRAHKVKVSLFQNGFSNLIDYNFVTEKFQNLNKARTLGVEFLHQFESEMWDSEISLAEISATDETRKVNLLRRPRHQVSLRVGQALTDSLRFTNELIYLGEREDNNALGVRMTLPSVVLWNTALIYKRSSQSQYFVRVNNAGNTFYEDLRGYLTPGRFVWTGLKISF